MQVGPSYSHSTARDTQLPLAACAGVVISPVLFCVYISFFLFRLNNEWESVYKVNFKLKLSPGIAHTRLSSNNDGIEECVLITCPAIGVKPGVRVRPR